MTPRKWLALAASVSLVALLSAGLSVAAVQEEEEESELHKLMENVSAANNRINRYVRTPVGFRKSQDDVVKYAKELVELGKKARESEDALKDVEDIENPKEQWITLMDEFIKHSEELVKISEEGDQPKARATHTDVKRACAECHKVFRIVEDF